MEETRRAGLQTHTGVFRRITDDITLVLRDQQPGSIKPVYGRNGLIRGHISLRSSVGLTDVTLKVWLRLSSRFYFLIFCNSLRVKFALGHQGRTSPHRLHPVLTHCGRVHPLNLALRPSRL